MKKVYYIKCEDTANLFAKGYWVEWLPAGTMIKLRPKTTPFKNQAEQFDSLKSALSRLQYITQTMAKDSPEYAERYVYSVEKYYVS